MNTGCPSPTTSALRAWDTTDGFMNLLYSMAHTWLARFVLSAN
jgi:hypothetical protein